jgi:hypothetical protein
MCLAGCATRQEPIALAPTSIQSVMYYPFQVKGYQDTYPKRRVVVIPVTDARDFSDAAAINHQPEDGHPLIGAVLDKDGKLAQRLYGPPLEPLVQAATVQAATEAGMAAVISALPLSGVLAARNSDYVVAIKLTRVWVKKSRTPDSSRNPGIWRAEATAALEAAIYKPPFDVAFWRGEAAATFDDPPLAANSAGPDDEVAIYEEPGEVLSAALTRAVASIFKRDDLRTLIDQDPMPRR